MLGQLFDKPGSEKGLTVKKAVQLQNKYKELSTAYDLLTSQNSRQMSEKAKETKRLLEQLEEAQNKRWEIPLRLRCWRSSMRTMIKKAASND